MLSFNNYVLKMYVFVVFISVERICITDVWSRDLLKLTACC